MEPLKTGIAIAICLYFLIAAYGVIRGEVPNNFNITSTSVVVNWFESELDLQAEVGDFEIAGLSQCEYRPEFNHSFCELWLVRPLHLDDAYAFDTIGHEFYHALVGDFHVQ